MASYVPGTPPQGLCTDSSRYLDVSSSRWLCDSLPHLLQIFVQISPSQWSPFWPLHSVCICTIQGASLVAWTVKNLPTMRETRIWFLGWGHPLEKGRATHSSILAWRIPWTEERGGLQSMGSQRAEHNWAGARWWCGFWNLSSPTETEPGALAWKPRVLTTGPPQKFPVFYFGLLLIITLSIFSCAYLKTMYFLSCNVYVNTLSIFKLSCFLIAEFLRVLWILFLYSG